MLDSKEQKRFITKFLYRAISKKSQPSDRISKNKIRKAISIYMYKEYDMNYHRRQIKEFFSKTGFETTFQEDRRVYLENKDDEEFIKLLKLIYIAEFDVLSKKFEKALYHKLVK